MNTPGSRKHCRTLSVCSQGAAFAALFSLPKESFSWPWKPLREPGRRPFAKCAKCVFLLHAHITCPLSLLTTSKLRSKARLSRTLASFQAAALNCFLTSRCLRPSRWPAWRRQHCRHPKVTNTEAAVAGSARVDKIDPVFYMPLKRGLCCALLGGVWGLEIRVVFLEDQRHYGSIEPTCKESWSKCSKCLGAFTNEVSRAWGPSYAAPILWLGGSVRSSLREGALSARLWHSDDQ